MTNKPKQAIINKLSSFFIVCFLIKRDYSDGCRRNDFQVGPFELQAFVSYLVRVAGAANYSDFVATVAQIRQNAGMKSANNPGFLASGWNKMVRLRLSI